MYSLTLAVVAGALLAWLVSTGAVITSPIAIAILSAIAFWSEKQSIRLNGSTQLSVAFLPIVFAAVAFGPLAAMVVAAASLLVDFGYPYVRWAVWTTTRMIVGASAGFVAVALNPLRFDNFVWLLAVVAVVVWIETTVELSLGVLTLRVRRSGSVRAAIRALTPILSASIPLYAPIVAISIYAYRALSPWTLVLFLLPTLAAQWLFALYRKQRETGQELTAVNERLERANLSFAIALVATLDARDPYMSGHSTAVSRYARDIAQRLQLGEEEQRLAELCGLVHDVGKIGLPPGLLEKAGPLTRDERRIMEQHSVIGERILANVADYTEIATIVRHHHERVDGGGYPDGLVGEAIPLLSRVVAVADAYDAMTSDRPYRNAMPSAAARMRLTRASDTQFDARVVEAFDAVLADASESYRTGARPSVVPAEEPAGLALATA